MPAFLKDPEVWVLIGFVIFVVAVWRPARRFIISALDARAERIAQQIEEAAALRREAEAMLHGAEERQRAAVAETEAIVRTARDEVERLKVAAAASLEATLQRRRQAALEKIAQAEAAAIAEVRLAAVEVAIAATRRILQAEVTGAVADRMIDQSIAGLTGRLN